MGIDGVLAKAAQCLLPAEIDQRLQYFTFQTFH